MATPNYDINYDDKRFTEVEADKKAALNEVDVTYGNMINNSDKYYQDRIDAVEAWEDKQTQLQQERTDFTIEQINQQKEQTKKDYLKEQSGAYADWQKQSGEYGTNAEMMAAQGMTGSGFSESSQVSMYNTYQMRVATAREAYTRAVLNYDNAIKDAQLQNNAALAEIAYNALQQSLELSLEGFQYKNQLIMAQVDKKAEVDDRYYNRYQDVLKQINTENALAEEVRQYNANLAEEQRQYNNTLALQKSQLQLEKDKFSYQKEQDAIKAAALAADDKPKNKVSYKDSHYRNSRFSALKQADTSAYWSTVKDRKINETGAKLDTRTLTALGYSAKNGAAIAEAEKKGVIESYVKNGVRYFKPSTKNLKNTMLYSRLR